MTLIVVILMLVPPSWRAPSPALVIVAPPVILALMTRPPCSLRSPLAPSRVVPETLPTVMVGLAPRAMLPEIVGIERMSSRLAEVMLPVSVSRPAAVCTNEPPSAYPPWPWKVRLAIESLKPSRSSCEPPRTVTLEASAIWLLALRATRELATAPEPVPLILPPVMMRSPVMALVVVVLPLTPRTRMTPFT